MISILVAGMISVNTLAASPSGAGDLEQKAVRTAREGLIRGIAGDVVARQKTLDRAVRESADCALAHWHLGQLLVDGQWLSIDEVERRMAQDAQWAEYQSLRDKALNDPRRELALANWCRRHRIKDAEQLHLHRVLQNSEDVAERNEAIKRLGLRPYLGQLRSEAEIAELEREQAVYQQNLKKWTPVVEKWRKALESGQARQEQIREQIRNTVEPAAIPAMESILSVKSEPLALEVVLALGHLADPAASESLVRHAIHSEWSTVRDAVIVQLKERAVHDFVPLLLRELVPPVETRFQVEMNSDGTVRHTHQFLREGPQENHLLTASYVTGPLIQMRTVRMPNPRAADPAGRRARAQLSRVADTQRQQRSKARLVSNMAVMQESSRAAAMEQEVARANDLIATNNEHIFDLLEQTTGEAAIQRIPEAWWSWWQDYNEMYRGDKPTYTQSVVRFEPLYLPSTTVRLTSSCFPAGTPVRTQSGLIAIEKIQIGDRVLSQNIQTGELAYKLVLQTTERPLCDQLQIDFGGTAITTTKGHLFWVNAIGWRMAKRLTVGEQVHTLDGGRTIDRIEVATPAKAYNLVVADFNNYFVGPSGVLVHDVTHRKPFSEATPGLPAHHLAMKR